MRKSFAPKTWVWAISIAWGSSVAVHASGSVGKVNCVVNELRRDFSSALGPTIAFEKLTSEIASRRARVPEFEFIKKEAEKRGLRVWLFGGTAAGYGHYVKWDLLREAGDLRFQKARFDYDYTNIYRSTQDLDIVVDGSAQQAKDFQQALKTQFPYFVGSKATPWEVRSLRESSGDKGAILDDFGFMNQHTDSNSTGMIELTDPPKGESVVRDVRDWKNATESRFLKDVHEGELTYYFSPTHGKTERAKQGKNPPIFSVVRALTKAFQYDLKIRPEDLTVMKREIDHFDPSRDLKNADARRWIEKNGKKLYQHAVDIEYASEVLERLGLKKKLISIENNPSEQDSLAWWMNKEPLRSKSVGAGSGRTAKELGLDIVAHETGNFLAYESITRAHTGEPNVLISRNGKSGETAAYGDGFYTAIGTKGARGTGITIRFKVSPKAREGRDFKIAGDYVIWRNKSAIRVIPESLEMSPSQYFQFLADGKEISADDEALMWKLRRRLDHRFASGLADPAELRKIRKLVMKNVKSKSSNHELVFQEWLKVEGARAGKPAVEVDELIEWIANKSYKADPGPTADGLSHLAYGTETQAWMDEEYIPSLLKDLMPDVGDRAIENALASRLAVVRKFGLKALAYAEKTRPSARIRMIRKLTKENAHRPIDLERARAWLKSDLRTNSSFPVFEKIVGADRDALALLDRARAESFQFQKFEIPIGGKKLQLGSPPTTRDFILTIPFEIQATPVTQLQWILVMVGKNSKFENPAQFKGKDVTLNGIPVSPNRPIETVSWDDAQDFIRKLNQLDPHYEYRLPTEAEWQASARGGSDTTYFYGDSVKDFPQYGWHRDAGEFTHDVASLKPNPMGLFDVHGNVWEWVEDPFELGIQKRVVRGGGWSSDPSALYSTVRGALAHDGRFETVGFRLVRTPKP